MKHIRGTHRSHVSGRRFIKSAAKRGITDRLREEAERLNDSLKNSNFVDYPMCRSCILQHYFTIIGENCIIIIY